jgi:S-disulfanyl-L-cysteine oxidoreductase SoxD
MKPAVVFIRAIIVIAAAGSAAALQPSAARSPKEGVYTAVQADEGKATYEAKCLSCHGSMASFTPDMAPLLNDHLFQAGWKNRSLAELFERIRETMPQNEPGTLSPKDTANIVAYVLSANKLPAGSVALPEDVDSLKAIVLETDPW